MVSNAMVLHEKRRAGALMVAAAIGGLLAACGSGEGGNPPPPPPPPARPLAVLAVSAPMASQSSSGRALLAFRAALVDNVAYPVTLNFAITGGTSGTDCGAGIDFVVPTASGLVITANGATTSGQLSIGSAASERQLNVLMCPVAGAADRTLTLTWNDTSPNGAGEARGLARGSDNTAFINSKRLNDTGITTCSNAGANALACPQAGFAGQDGELGRDAQSALTGAGSSRISAFFLTALPGGAGCVQDNVTGLLWEGKGAAGLHAAGSTYSWFASSGANGGAAGSASAGVCSGSGCDTEKFVAAVNAEALCGFRDWRLPTAEELAGIVDSGAATAPTVRPQFANQLASTYWSASPRAGAAADAWQLDFNSGAVGFAAKSTANRVRLVRGN
ncbi:MAG: DUF1566 domain-containing protein [Pseudomonadota bacterium]